MKCNQSTKECTLLHCLYRTMIKLHMGLYLQEYIIIHGCWEYETTEVYFELYF